MDATTETAAKLLADLADLASWTDGPDAWRDVVLRRTRVLAGAPVNLHALRAELDLAKRRAQQTGMHPAVTR